jgi:hypothetical protein
MKIDEWLRGSFLNYLFSFDFFRKADYVNDEYVNNWLNLYCNSYLKHVKLK